MIKAVLFDMDGIQFDTEIVMKEGWQKAARELNFTLTEEHLSQMRGSALPRSRKLFEEWFHGEVTYDEGRAIRSAYLNDYIQRNGVPEKPGLHEFLSWLKEHSIKVAVATSTTRRVAEGYRFSSAGSDCRVHGSRGQHQRSQSCPRLRRCLLHDPGSDTVYGRTRADL